MGSAYTPSHGWTITQEYTNVFPSLPSRRIILFILQMKTGLAISHPSFSLTLMVNLLSSSHEQLWEGGLRLSLHASSSMLLLLSIPQPQWLLQTNTRWSNSNGMATDFFKSGASRIMSASSVTIIEYPRLFSIKRRGLHEMSSHVQARSWLQRGFGLFPAWHHRRSS